MAFSHDTPGDWRGKRGRGDDDDRWLGCSWGGGMTRPICWIFDAKPWAQ
jgi:hypothetical protein